MGITSFMLSLRGIELREHEFYNGYQGEKMFDVTLNGEVVGSVGARPWSHSQPWRKCWIIHSPEHLNCMAIKQNFPGKESAASWLIAELQRGK